MLNSFHTKLELQGSQGLATEDVIQTGRLGDVLQTLPTVPSPAVPAPIVPEAQGLASRSPPSISPSENAGPVR